MDLSTYKLPTSSLSFMFGVTDRTIQYWCRTKKVRCEKTSENGKYKIFADSLIDFLYRNPKYANPYLEQKGSGVSHILHEAICSELLKRPRSYSINQISDIYGITENAIRNWEASNLLHNNARKEGVKGIFEKDLEDFFEKNPGIARRYLCKEEDDYASTDGDVAV